MTSITLNYTIDISDTTIGIYLAGTGAPKITWENNSSATTTPPLKSTPYEYTHTYATTGSYQITIAKNTQATNIKQLGNGTTAASGIQYLKSVSSFGSVGLLSLNGAFYGATGLNNIPSSLPTTSSVTDLGLCFANSNINDASINNWNTTAVTNMSSMFQNASSFNQNISVWITSAVTNMSSMFQNASSFNQNISVWNTTAVTNMSSMFQNASSFNQNISGWNVSKVTDFSNMFNGAIAFNNSAARLTSNTVPLNWSLNKTNNLNLSNMFFNAKSFSQDLSWNIQKVSTMANIFDMSNTSMTSTLFNKILNRWYISNTIPNNVILNRIKYSYGGNTAVDYLKQTKGWTINGYTGRNSGNGYVSYGPQSVTKGAIFTFIYSDISASPIINHGYTLVNSTNPSVILSTFSTTSQITSYTFNNVILNSNSNLYIIDNSLNTIVDEVNINVVFGNLSLIYNIPTASTTIGIYLAGSGSAEIYWGDGFSTGTLTSTPTEYKHTYVSANTFTVDISGTNVTQLGNGATQATGIQYLVKVLNFGNVGLRSLNGAFNGATNLTNLECIPVSLPTTTAITDLRYCFANSFMNDFNITKWNTSSVTNMSNMFYGDQSFNQSISNWDVTKVTDFSDMFNSATSFNNNGGLNPLSWTLANTGTITLARMFYNARSFNQYISGWNTSAVTAMNGMFYSAVAFNENISNWDVRNVTTFLNMFNSASAFNNGAASFTTNTNPLSWTLNTSGSVDLTNMFLNAINFSQDISWNIQNVTNMTNMFDKYNTSMTSTLFDGILNSWSGQISIPHNIIFNTIKYTSGGQTALNTLTNSQNNWTINDNIGAKGLVTYSPTDVFQDMSFSLVYTVDSAPPINGQTYILVNSNDITNVLSTFTPYGGESSYTFNDVVLNSNATLYILYDHNIDSYIVDSVNVNVISNALTLNYKIITANTVIGVYLSGSENATIDWGDNRTNTYTLSTIPNEYVHNYTARGYYTVKITGNNITQFGNGGGNTATNISRLETVSTFGNIGLTSLNGAFYGATSLTSLPTSLPPSIIDLGFCFRGSNINDPSISTWETSHVTNMSFMFANCRNFNQDISSWNTSSVRNMSSMFGSAINFNQDISGWNTSAVTDMSRMFGEALNFNQDISGWDTSAVTDMSYMFQNCPFNQDIGMWITSNVINMSGMFANNSVFNQNISGWSVNNVLDFSQMFSGSSLFNNGADALSSDTSPLTWSLNNTKPSKSINMAEMFYNSTSFSQDISSWNIQNVTNMQRMFGSNNSMTSPLFNKTLNAWAELTTIPQYIIFDTIKYTLGGTKAVNTLKSTPNNWFINYNIRPNGGLVTYSPRSVNKDESFILVYSVNNIPPTNGNTYNLVRSDNPSIPITTPFTCAGELEYTFTNVILNDENFSTLFIVDTNANSIVDQIQINIMSDNLSLNYSVTNVANMEIGIYLSGSENASVHWGDNSIVELLSLSSTPTEFKHTYSATGTYSVNISGTNISQLGNGATQATGINLLSSVSSFGNVGLTSLNGAFYKATGLNNIPSSLPTTSSVTDLGLCFSYSNINDADIVNWDTSAVTSMAGMFSYATDFNQNLSNWHVNTVTVFTEMFKNAPNFNNGDSPLYWSLSDIGPIIMTSMFYGASQFNQDISWNTDTVCNMRSMFQNATSFNQNVSNWNIRNVTDFTLMFANAYAFNNGNNRLNWFLANTGTISFDYMFSSANAFNQDISWNTNVVLSMEHMFEGATSFNKNVSGWEVGNVTSFNSMFLGATAFNNGEAPLTSNTAPLTWPVNTSGDVKITMERMFYNATSFSQDISSWNVKNVSTMSTMFDPYNTSMTSTLFNNMLNEWSGRETIPQNVVLDSIKYTLGGETGLNVLINTQNNWTINGNSGANGLVSYRPTSVNSGVPFTLVYTVDSIPSISGHVYNLINSNNPSIISSFTSAGQASYTFPGVVLYDNNYSTLYIIDTSLNSIVDAVYINTFFPCFKEGTKILTDRGYVPIEHLRKGDMVKTPLDEYKPVFMIGKKVIYNHALREREKNQLYVCSPQNYPEVFEDLVITGCHSILEDDFISVEQREKVREINGGIYITAINCDTHMFAKCRVPACVDERTVIFKKEGPFTIYHIALENDNMFNNYGIYANGLLVETCSKRYLTELSNMDQIETTE